MKTLKIFTVAALVACLAACGGKTNENGSGVDSAAVEENVETTVDNIATAADIESPEQISEEITKAVEAADESKAQKLIEVLQQKIEELKAAGATAEVAEYAAKLKDLYEANKDKIQNLPGISEAVGQVVTSSGVEEVINSLKSINPDIISDETKAKLDEAKGLLDAKANELRDKANEKVNESVDKGVDKVKEKVKDDASKAVDDARKKLGI